VKAPVVQRFDNGWFIEKEVVRRGKTYRQWFRIKDEGIIQAALAAEALAVEADVSPPEPEFVPQEVLRRKAAAPKLPVERTAVISKVIEEVSGTYCKKVWWADRLELMQEAWLTVLHALERKPVPDEWLRGTVARIASRRMAQFLWECTSPATGARGGRHFQGVKRASELELAQQASSVPAPDARITEAEATAGVAEAREALYWRVRELYAEALKARGQAARELIFEVVLRVLVDGVQSSQAAEEAGVEIAEVYAETMRVKRLIVGDQPARELLEEISDWRGDL
jgi:hypothetical protein